MKNKLGNKAKNIYALTDNIIAYESGQLLPSEMLELFSELIKNGMVWTLQGSYGRTAKELIDRGYISEAGKILQEIEG